MMRQLYTMAAAQLGWQTLLHIITGLKRVSIAFFFNSTNLSDLEKFLFEKNHIFVDENENMIIYSSCNNIYNKNCNFKFVFVSKIDFSFYEMAIVGDALPRLTGYAMDYNRRVFYVNIVNLYIWRNRL